MEYLVAFQVLCAGFAAFVAARKGRSAILWFAVGLLPVVGVVLALTVERPSARREGRGKGAEPRPPRRCRGSYIPDCEGCPFFTRPLFDASYQGPKKGYCKRFERTLSEEAGSKGGRVTFDE